MHIARGTFRIIRVDGREELHEQRPSIGLLHAAIGCTCMDTVLLDRDNRTIMLVDDTGIITGKPINPEATKLYRSICKPDCQDGIICGDVALANDEDF